MARLSSALAFLSLALLTLLAPRALGQPVPTDPRPVIGQLENGLTYMILRHDNPPGRAAAWLHVSTGSLNETDQQRGVAHFLEHMAFNGSENYPPGSVIPFFQSLGLTFGQHQNAFTSFDQTTYQLALPDNKPETLDKALLFLSDVAFRLTLPPAEIDKERGVILEERRARLGGQQRIQDYFLERVAPGSLLGQRLPIGTEETIQGMTPEDFRAYYQKWYVPSNMTLMIVADAEPAAMVEQVTRHFGPGPKAPRPEDQAAGIKPYDSVRAIIATDPELNSASVGLLWIAPPEPPATTIPLVRRDVIDSIASWIFNRRLQQKVAEGKVSFQGGGAGVNDLFRAGRLSSASASGEPGKWREMLTDLATEVQRARLRGFTDQELEDARKAILAAAERAVETDRSRPAQAILASWDGALADGEPITSAEQDLEMMKQLLPTVKAAEVSARFAELFNAAQPMTFNLTMPSGAAVPTEQDLIAAGQQALSVQPEAEVAASRPSALMATPPTPGKIAEEAEHAEGGVWSAWLENGVRVHHKFMDYRKDQVIVEISLAGGEIQETAANRGITQAAAIALNRPATSTMNSTTIRDLMTGKKVTVSARVGMDQVVLSVSGSPAELERGMQLAHLLLTDPVIEPANFQQWQIQQRINAGIREKQIEGVFGKLLMDTVWPKGEVRTKPIEIPHVDALSVELAQERLNSLIASAPIEVAVVGEIDRQRAAELVRTYVGSLRSRPRISRDVLADLRKLERPTGPLSGRTSLKTKTDKALVLTGFYGTDAKNLRDTRLLAMASRILTNRAITKIREEKQLAYGPSVTSSAALEFPGFGVFFGYSYTAVDKTEALVAAFSEMFADFAAKGPTVEELETARKQMANTFEERVREPAYWMNALITLDYRWMTLAEFSAGPAEYQKFTAEEIRDGFGRYFKPESSFSVVVIPEPLAPAPPAAPPADASGLPPLPPPPPTTPAPTGAPQPPK